MTPIDVWKPGSFDVELARLLDKNGEAVLRYFETDHRIFLEHELGRGPGRSLLRPSNPYADRFSTLTEAVAGLMGARAIRAWHYTRLTGSETEAVRRDGIHLSTRESLRRRLDAVVKTGAITADAAAQLYAQSPFHSTQLDSREGRFWMTSHPVAIDDGGVTPLMAHWGGEVASMWVKDPALTAPLAKLGTPTIIEVAVPVDLADCGHAAARAAIAAFARSRGGIPSKHAFDLNVTSPLPASAVLAIHSEEDVSFTQIGRSFPPGYVDVDIGRWKELTGDDA